MVEQSQSNSPGKEKNISLDIRYTEPSDALALKEWLTDPNVREGFAMEDEPEIIDAVNRWMSFSRYRCSLTALADGIPCGIATLYLNPYKAILHQCEFGIVVAASYQGKGIGSTLMRNIMHLAKNQFHIELLHLAVKANNPAVPFYKKFGFVIYGEQKKWGKEKDGSFCARLLMECELDQLDTILKKTYTKQDE